MAKQIKPFVAEISLAFDPANQKKFLMKKEAKMPKSLIKILQSEDALVKETAIDAALEAISKTNKMSKDAQSAVKGALKILTAFEKELPEGVLSTLFKDIPEYEVFIASSPAETDADRDVRLKKEREVLEKEIREAVTIEVRAALEKEYKGGDAEMKKTITDLTTQVSTLKKDLDESKDEKRRGEITTMLKEINVIGDVEKMTRSLFTLEKMDKEMFKDEMKRLTETSTLLEQSELFKEQGSNGEGDLSGSKPAYKKLVGLVKDLMNKEKLKESEAWIRVGKENPTLYKEYREGAK